MNDPSLIATDESIVDAMLQLVRAQKSHRMVVAGPRGYDILVELHRRGYSRVTASAIARFPCGQYDAALVAWDSQTPNALQPTLDVLIDFINPAGALVIWISSHDHAPRVQLRPMLNALGFRIECGTCCEDGAVILARRTVSPPIAKAA